MNKAQEIIELFEYVLETSEKTGHILPYRALKSALLDLKQLVQDEEPEYFNEGKVVNQVTSRPRIAGEKRNNGLASRIKPVPAEVRGRVRELVDLISDDAQFDDNVENN